MKQAYNFFEDYQETLPQYNWYRPDEETKHPEYTPDDIRWCPEQYRGLTEAELLKKLVRNGMDENGFTGKPEYESRLEHEMSVVLGKGFERYFILIWDIMSFCRRAEIEYGIGRGSGMSSLVGYCLKITGDDPLKYNLLFERFLDPERNDMPDYDLDIQDTRRGEVKRYLENKYGKEHVAGISTFGTYAAKSAFKAACRVMGVPYKESEDGSETIIEESDLHKENILYKKYPGLKDIAIELYGKISNTGRHAAGVVVADKPLTEYVSIETRSLPGEDGREAVVAADKNMAEQIGLVKIDLLGLKSLSVIADAVENVRKSQGIKIDWKDLKEDDPKVFDMISKGNTSALFQAEESASTKLILEMGVHNFDDLVTSNALVRSGAYNAFGKDYIATKKGHKKPKYPTPESKEFLEDSYGFAVMQEQSMLIVQKVAGMSAGESNQIRRLTAKKKDKSTLAPFKDKFIKGCLANNVSQKEADKLWADIETTAEYQFNKCLVGDTKIVTYEYGEITILEAKEKLDAGEVVSVSGPESIDGPRVGEQVWHEIEEIIDSGEQETVKIWVDSNIELVSSFNHRHRLQNRWKEARRIHKNDRIWTSGGKESVGGRKYMGIQQTYDVVLSEEPHAFYANGILTHNSHAVAYSKLTYATAYLKRYYPGEFMAAVLKNESDTGKIGAYLAECSRLGIKVNTPDVNASDIDYAYKNGQIYMGLSSVKYISEKTADKIIAARPFHSGKDLIDFHKTKYSGFNSRAFEAIKAIGGLRVPDVKYNEAEVNSNYFEYLGIPSFGNIELTPSMRDKLVRLEDFKSEIAVVKAIVQKIETKPTFTKVSVVDETGQGTFFINDVAGLKKGSRYFMLVDDNSIVDKMSLDDYDGKHPIVKYLQGEMDNHIWVVGGSFRMTKAGKPMATIVYSHGGKLKSFMSVGADNITKIKRECVRGKRIKLALSKDGKWLEDVKAVE